MVLSIYFIGQIKEDWWNEYEPYNVFIKYGIRGGMYAELTTVEKKTQRLLRRTSHFLPLIGAGDDDVKEKIKKLEEQVVKDLYMELKFYHDRLLF